MVVSKSDLIDEIFANLGENDKKFISKAATTRIVNAVFEDIVKHVTTDDDVTITKFGTFTKTASAPRTYNTPHGVVQTGKTFKMKFKVSKIINEALNK